MPGGRAKGERLLEDALAALARALDEAEVPWMLIGGIAVIAHGVRRFTTDIDAAVRGDAISVDRLLERLARHDIAPRIPDAAAFARDNLVLLVESFDAIAARAGLCLANVASSPDGDARARTFAPRTRRT